MVGMLHVDQADSTLYEKVQNPLTIPQNQLPKLVTFSRNRRLSLAQTWRQQFAWLLLALRNCGFSVDLFLGPSGI